MEALKARLAEIHKRMAQAIETRGPGPDVKLIAVSKTQPLAAIRAAIQLGVYEFGENYAQELTQKQDALQSEFPNLRFHFIGTPQSNKLKTLVGRGLIHSLGQIHHAKQLNQFAAERSICQDVLISVNLGQESQKSGVFPGQAREFLTQALECAALRCLGLMCIPPVDPSVSARVWFRRLRELRDELEVSLGVSLPHLSMGMSDDFPEAILEGATFIRVGSALFGPRQ